MDGDRPCSDGCIPHDTSEQLGFGTSGNIQEDDIYLQHNVPHSEAMLAFIH